MTIFELVDTLGLASDPLPFAFLLQISPALAAGLNSLEVLVVDLPVPPKRDLDSAQTDHHR